jgi:hypothetical protein
VLLTSLETEFPRIHHIFGVKYFFNLPGHNGVTGVIRVDHVCPYPIRAGEIGAPLEQFEAGFLE